jgi:hypothetical protein
LVIWLEFGLPEGLWRAAGFAADFEDTESSERDLDRASHNPPAATNAAMARNRCFLFIVFRFWFFRYGIMRGFPEVALGFGTKAGNSGAKRPRAGMNLSVRP